MRIQVANDALATIEMDEGKANAISPSLIVALGEAVAEIEKAGARGLVLTGSGRHFCAGLDLSAVSALSQVDFEKFLVMFEEVFSRLFFFPAPVVAAVNGNAVAGGCILAAAADHRVAATGTYKVGTNEVRIGVNCPSIVLDILRALLTPSQVHKIVLGAELYDPATAQSLGLLDELVDPERLLTRAREVARAWMASPTPGFAAQKKELRSRYVDPHRPGYPASRGRFDELWHGAEATAARAAVLRKP
jgi:enoyl-CoA hydratase